MRLEQGGEAITEKTGVKNIPNRKNSKTKDQEEHLSKFNEGQYGWSLARNGEHGERHAQRDRAL